MGLLRVLASVDAPIASAENILILEFDRGSIWLYVSAVWYWYIRERFLPSSGRILAVRTPLCFMYVLIMECRYLLRHDTNQEGKQ